MRRLETNRWTGVAGLALLAVGLAVVLGRRPAILLAGVFGVAYAAYARSGDAPDPSLRVERDLADATPDPDDEVRVTVRVTNEGERPLFDLRLVDGVPSGLAVVEGSPRHATALRPDKSVAFDYAVGAVRGAHEWEPLHAIARDPSGARESVSTVGSVEPTELRCTPELSATADLPLRGLTSRYAGGIATDVGGSGIEFHSTREYRHGDPLKRVDWNRLARTGELATLDLREERAATIVLLIDAREGAYLTAEAGEANAVERSVEAAALAFPTLVGGGDRVGIAAFGPEDLWLAPGAGNDHRARVRETLATHPAVSPTPTEGRFFPALQFRRLRKRLPADAQVLLFSPLCDDYVGTVAERLDAHGHLVTVVSPDPTGDDSPGHQLARIERALRLAELRRTGIRVVDWSDESLAAAITEAAGRWSA